MKLISFAIGGGARYGGVLGSRVVDLTTRLGPDYPSLEAVFQAGALARAQEALGADGPSFSVEEVEFLLPFPNARRIFCVGANYRKPHPLGGRVEAPANPSIFFKSVEALAPHRGALRRPIISEQFDYEGELAVVIGRGGERIAAEDALSHIAGYSCFDDGSVRDFQKHSVTAGKNFVRSGSWGPWIVTADELPHAAKLTLRTRLNGREVQNTTTDQMLFTLPEIIRYLSAITPLLPGDVIATGSPEGTGATQTPPRFLVSGDRLEIEIEGVGTLANRVE
jgi:2-keto-4-pentenoate hydratase/2-oxohepta-3-ene-1,7-dioic acid hydratase in catechol pathway